MDKTSNIPRIRDFLNWPILGILLCWGILITQVRHHWGGESYYNFGMFVPFLAAWLWLRNMAPGDYSASKSKTGPGVPLLVLLVLSIAFVIPFHALSEVNPFWRLPLWAQAFGLVCFSAIAIYSLYGFKGLLKSIFPLFFLCMMIPWPWRIEQAIIQTLTGYVAAIAVDGLHFVGYPVELTGNSMRLGELGIGVNEACSGIRSLQALTMVTLFLGSLFGQGVWRRVVALLILPFIVIVINSLRAMFLATQVIVNGHEAYDGWHDPAGYIAFGVSMLIIYACIEALNIGSKRDNSALGISLAQAKRLLLVDRVPSVSSLLFLALPITLYVSVEGWFQIKEHGEQVSPEWSFVLPEEDNPDFLYQEMDQRVVDLLGYDYGSHFLFRKNGDLAQVFYYGYTDENKLSSVSSYGHKPTICMESTGSSLVEQYPDLLIRKDNLVLPFHHYLFAFPGGEDFIHVFSIVWEKRNMDVDPDLLEDLSYKAQWLQLLKGRRDFSRKVMLIGLTTDKGETKARDTVREFIENRITQTVND